MEIYNYKKTFKDNPENEFELKIDPNLDEEIKTLKFKHALVHLIISEYVSTTENIQITVPKEMEENKIEWIGNDTRNIMDGFLLEYEITNNINDFTKSSEIIDWLNRSKLGISFKKFFIELKKYAQIKKYDKVQNIKKKIDGNTENVWIGIKNVNNIQSINNVVKDKDVTNKKRAQKSLVKSNGETEGSSKKKKSIPKKIKQLVWNKHMGEENGNGLCTCCEVTKISQMDFICGHIVSENNGGQITVDNLTPICSLCNSSMGTKNLNEFKKLHGLGQCKANNNDEDELPKKLVVKKTNEKTKILQIKR